MERPPGINTALLRAVVIIHAVGLLGLLIPATRHLFLMLVPYHLLTMFGLMLYSYAGKLFKISFFAFLIICAGWAVEYAGVQTGILFGRYAYGPTLGFGFAGVPLIIGINWFSLVYATGVVLNNSKESRSVIRILKGALILVLLDLLIEPVAVKLNYWHWADGKPPIQNYVCWFVVGALFLTLFDQFKFERQSRFAWVFLITQFVFFAALNLFI